MAAGLVAFVLFAGGVAVATYVGLHHNEPLASGRPSAAPTPRPSPTPSTGPSGVHNAALSSYLIDPPALATPVGVPEFDTGGSLPVADATKLSPLDPSFETQLLINLKYLDGAAVAWVSDDAEVVVAILQFDSPDFANGYFAEEQARVAQLCHQGDIHGTVYLPGSLTLVLARTDEENTRLTRSYAARGDMAVVVVTLQHDASLNWQLPDDPLVRQYNKL